MTSQDPVAMAVEGAVACLRIENGPLNILDVALRERLLERVLELESRGDIRVVSIEGAGEKAFSVGSDVREFPREMIGGHAKIRFEQFLLNRFARLPQVTIAKLRGHVLGGGSELMLACDFRLAAESAWIGFPEIKLGALPAAGGMKRLVRDVGPVRTRDLVFRGRSISAREAATIGLITECVPELDLDAAVDGLAAELSALPADALRLAKRCIAAVAGPVEVDTAEAEAFAELYCGANLREGVQAFIQKRPPKFNR